MAQIRPFYALTPSPDNAAAVSSLPNDVFTEKEAREITEANPLSFLNIVRPETMFPVGQNPYSDIVYQRAHDLLNKWKSTGVLIEQADKAFYIYRLNKNEQSQTGIVALSSVDDYLNGICKKHEHTVKEKEDDRARHIQVCKAQTGPIFMTYRPVKELKEIYSTVQTESPFFDFISDDNIRHTVWKISDKATCEKICTLFNKIPFTYIADGHHRSAAAVRNAIEMRKAHPDYTGDEEYNWFLSVLFPSDELKILDYNRIVLNRNALSHDEFLKQVENCFSVSSLPEMCHPMQRGTIHMYMESKWFSLSIKEDVLTKRLTSVDRLDVSLLQDLVLSPILGIENPRLDKRIQFIGGIKGLKAIEEIVDKHENAVGFALYPTSIDDLMDIADSGEVMPPKSTWFEPKLRSGLFIHEI